MKDRKTVFKFWTVREVEYLREAFKTKTEREIAKEMGRTIGQVQGAVQRYNIKSGRDGRFKKGQTSWNKGKHHRTSPATEFKKGGLPHNTKQDGVIVLRKDKRIGITYQYIRVSLAKWIPLHRYNWEQVNGPIPPKMVLIFKDKNTTNCEVDNLELITRRENMERNRNREKAGAAMKELWRKEKLRNIYGIGPKSGIGRLLNKKAA